MEPLADLAAVRDEIGVTEPPTDAQLSEWNTSGLSWTRVALRVLKRRLADYLANPASLGAQGLSLSTSANITALQKRIGELQIVADSEGSDADGDGRLEYGSRGRMVRTSLLRR